MAAFNKFNIFVQDLGRGVHNLHSHTLKVALSNNAPSSGNATLADITQISSGNGYSAGGSQVANNNYTQTSGVAKLLGDDVVFTASGGSIGPLRYVVFYNDTPTNPDNPLIGWWDYGSSITLNSGETFTVDFDGTNGILTLQ